MFHVEERLAKGGAWSGHELGAGVVSTVQDTAQACHTAAPLLATTVVLKAAVDTSR